MNSLSRTGPTLMVHFSTLVDPRIERTKQHSMTDVLVISICGFICGIDTWVELEEFAEIREDWFRTFLELPNGIPSHDTFGRFFAAMDPEEFSRCFARWMRSISEVTEGEVVPIDGKTLRRSFDAAPHRPQSPQVRYHHQGGHQDAPQEGWLEPRLPRPPPRRPQRLHAPSPAQGAPRRSEVKMRLPCPKKGGQGVSDRPAP